MTNHKDVSAIKLNWLANGCKLKIVMSPQPFFNNGVALQCVRFVDVYGREHEGVMLTAWCSPTELAYVDYFNWVVKTMPLVDLREVCPCALGIDRYVHVLAAEAGVPASVGAHKCLRTGGIGRHIRFETIVHRVVGASATLLVLLGEMPVQSFEEIVMRDDDITFRDNGDARYCFIPSKGCALTQLVIKRSENMRAVIARLSWAGLTAVCNNRDEYKLMQYTPDRLVRIAKTWSVDYVEDPINLSPKPVDMWTWHGLAPPAWPKQYFTFDGLGMQIAKEFDVLCTPTSRIPLPLRAYVERALQLRDLADVTEPWRPPSTPRISDAQMIQMNNCAYVREFSPYSAARKQRAAAISWVYLIHGHIVRIMGTYVLSGKFRGLGEHLRVFADETVVARHIAPASMGRLKWENGAVFGQKYSSQTGSVERDDTKKRRLHGATASADVRDPVA